MKKIAVNLFAFGVIVSGFHVSAKAGDLNSLMFVQASRLSLRTGPDLHAQINTFLPVNTAVLVESREGEWCRVSTSPQDKSDLQSGFVDCNFLTPTRLYLAQIDLELANPELTQKIRLDLLQKKFWLSPSWNTIANYAGELDKAFPIEANKEINRPRRVELESMKAFLQQGWSPAKFEYTPAKPEIVPAKTLNFTLPVVSPSLFKDKLPHLVIAPYIGDRLQKTGYDTAYMANVYELLNETLARREVGSLHFTHIRDPFQLEDYKNLNAWDMSGYAVQFDGKGLPVTVLSADGSHSNNFIVRGSTETDDEHAECDQIGETLEFAAPFSEKKARQGVLALLIDPPPTSVTNIKRTQSELKVLSNQESGETYNKITGKPFDVFAEDGYTFKNIGYKAFFMVFDLNGDGIPDIAFEGIEGKSNFVTGPDSDRIYSVLVNLNGQWVTYGSFSQNRCAD